MTLLHYNKQYIGKKYKQKQIQDPKGMGANETWVPYRALLLYIISLTDNQKSSVNRKKNMKKINN